MAGTGCDILTFQSGSTDRFRPFTQFQGRRPIHRVRRLVVLLQQGCQPSQQRHILRTSVREKSRAIWRRERHGLAEQALFFAMAVRRAHCFISRASQARAKAQWRFAVAGEISMVAAASSIVKPTK